MEKKVLFGANTNHSDLNNLNKLIQNGAIESLKVNTVRN